MRGGRKFPGLPAPLLGSCTCPRHGLGSRETCVTPRATMGRRGDSMRSAPCLRGVMYRPLLCDHRWCPLLQVLLPWSKEEGGRGEGGACFREGRVPRSPRRSLLTSCLPEVSCGHPELRESLNCQSFSPGALSGLFVGTQTNFPSDGAENPTRRDELEGKEGAGSGRCGRPLDRAEGLGTRGPAVPAPACFVGFSPRTLGAPATVSGET
uniref:uncharacterized protein LOC129502021 n=1 Tax=Nyctereutes procyonoides TaxID=34880 RepID=UPI002443F2AB|nr:uncharacterized protein LOC129502021 [Nyctereutes procyonoides]